MNRGIRVSIASDSDISVYALHTRYLGIKPYIKPVTPGPEPPFEIYYSIPVLYTDFEFTMEEGDLTPNVPTPPDIPGPPIDDPKPITNDPFVPYVDDSYLWDMQYEPDKMTCPYSDDRHYYYMPDSWDNVPNPSRPGIDDPDPSQPNGGVYYGTVGIGLSEVYNID